MIIGTATDDHRRSTTLFQGTLLCLVSLFLFPYNMFAAQATLSWNDLHNDLQDVGGYYVYYWQETWDAPARVAVLPTAIPCTLTGLEAGQTYHFAVTAYDRNGARESAFSNAVSLTTSTLTPTASFDATPMATGPLPLSVNFVDTSTGIITSWLWAFGDGGISTAKNPRHTYTAAGTYTVTLTATGPDGSDSATRTGYITVLAPAPGLVAAYNFDAGSGTTLADLSGNAHHGTISGATWTTTGKYGMALSFDGVDDWVSIAATPLLDLSPGATLMAWVYPTIASGVRDILLKEGPGVDIYNLYARNWRGQPENNAYINGANQAAEGVELPAHVWTHIAGTYNGNVLQLYLNGIEVAHRPVTGPIASSTGPLRIGGNSLWGEYFQGQIDEVRIYNRTLTADEVQTTMSIPVGSLPSDSEPPAISLTAPTSGAIVAGSSVTIAAAVSDNMGVVGVQFLLNGVNLGSEDIIVPYAMTWDTTAVPDGRYTVMARARDAAGNQTTSAEVSVTVHNLPPPPVAAFRATPTSGTAPLAVTFTDQSTGTIASRHWDFGDGQSSTDLNPIHTYTTSETYTVHLTVTGPEETHTHTKTAYIIVTPPNNTTEFFEFGEVQVGSTWRTVTFSRPFVTPIVVAKPPSNHGRAPALVRMRNVTSTGFQLRIQEWDYLDGVHRQETVGYLAVEQGQHMLGGTIPIEAGSLVTHHTTRFVTAFFDQAFDVAPVVLTAVASANGRDAVTTRVRKVTTRRFQVRLQEQEKNPQSHTAETITYIAWPPSSGMLASNVVFEVQKTPDAMTHQWKTLTFLESFTAIPVFLADLQTTDGGNPASLRWANTDFFGVDVKIAEEQSADNEMRHTTEVVGYMAFALHDVTTDSDGDGVTNADEILRYGTDPATIDTDQDGLNDGDEVIFWGPEWNTDADRDGLINLLDFDSDNDGNLDGTEQ